MLFIVGYCVFALQVQAMMSTINPHMSEASFDAFFDSLDVNHDGVVEEHEFARFLG